MTWEHSVRVYSDIKIGITLEVENLPDDFLELVLKSQVEQNQKLTKIGENVTDMYYYFGAPGKSGYVVQYFSNKSTTKRLTITSKFANHTGIDDPSRFEGAGD